MKLVRLTDHGIKGFNYYWVHRHDYKISKVELYDAGVHSGAPYGALRIIEPLKQAIGMLRPYGFGLVVCDSFRSPELYRLIQRKRLKVESKKVVDGMLNMVTMPHSTGLTVDVALVDLNTGEKIQMQEANGDLGACRLGYYENSENKEKQGFYRKRMLLKRIMANSGFRLGSKREFWHFEYFPKTA